MSYYKQEAADLDRQIASYYAKYGVDNVIEYRALRQTLTESEYQLLMTDMDTFAKTYPEYASLMPVRESIYKLDRMEALEQSVYMNELKIGAMQQSEVTAHLTRQAERGFQSTADALGLPKQFLMENQSIIRNVVNVDWTGTGKFSDRIWQNTDHIAKRLNTDIAAGFARGDNYNKLSKKITNEMVTYNKDQADRLIYTEGTFVMNESKAKVTEKFFDYYSVITAMDDRVCPECKALQDDSEAEPIPFKERFPGSNFPPLHPWCRCTYDIIVPDEQEWIDNYVEQNGGDPEISDEQKAHAKEIYDRLEGGAGDESE